jgi:hypothetical protein
MQKNARKGIIEKERELRSVKPLRDGHIRHGESCSLVSKIPASSSRKLRVLPVGMA